MMNQLNFLDHENLTNWRSHSNRLFNQINLIEISSEQLQTGLTIRYGLHETPFGKALIAMTSGGICGLSFLDSGNQQIINQELSQSWNKAEIIHDSQATKSLSEQIFFPDSSQHQMPLTLFVKGTNLQIQVWQTLLQIAWGEITTYSAIADILNYPTAVRAIGNAVGKNPIAYLIPCHRVIRKSGELGGYRWGLERKRLMLNNESHLFKNL